MASWIRRAAFVVLAGAPIFWLASRPNTIRRVERAAPDEEMSSPIAPSRRLDESWSRFANAAAPHAKSPDRSGLLRIRAIEDPVEFGMALGEVLREDPSLIEEVIGWLDEPDAERLFQIARALNGAPMDLLEARLRSLPAARRAIALHAILGRGEAVLLAADLYLHDPDEGVRAAAAFVLSERPDLAPDEVFVRARQDIVTASEPLRIEAMDLLGSRPLSPDDQRLIYENATSPALRLAAARALASGGADPALVRSLVPDLLPPGD